MYGFKNSLFRTGFTNSLMEFTIKKVLDVAISSMFNRNLRGHGFGYENIQFLQRIIFATKNVFVT